MSTTAADDVRSDDPTTPVPVDADSRSGQTFLVEVLARRAGAERRAAVSGRDIYAVTALSGPDDFLGALAHVLRR